MNRVAEYFFRRAWAVKEDVLGQMSKVIVRHVAGEKLTHEEIEAVVNKDARLRPGFEIVNGVARIPVTGIIAKRASMVNNTSQPKGTSTEQIAEELRRCLADPNVKSIALDIDSPGGGVGGVQDLAELIYSSRKVKPIVAYADGLMCSAAYWIGSAADKVYATKSSEVGSIGVYATYYDFSVMNHNEGIKTAVIKAGRNKAAGHPDVPMTEEDRKVIQEEVDAYYDLFIQDVARYRGISVEAATELATGRVYIGQKALELGLVDGLRSIDAALAGGSESKARIEDIPAGPVAAAAAQDGGGPSAPAEAGKGSTAEAQNTNHEEEEDMDLKTMNLEQLKAERPDLYEAIYGQGKSAGTTEERTRCLEILKQTDVKEFGGQAMVTIAREAISAGTSVKDTEMKLKDQRIKDLQTAGPETPGAGDGDEAPTAESQSAHLAAAKRYQAEHKCSLADALQATAPKTKRTVKK